MRLPHLKSRYWSAVVLVALSGSLFARSSSAESLRERAMETRRDHALAGGEDTPLWPELLAVIRGQQTDVFDPLDADRPDFTESSQTMGLRRLQIESGWTYLHDRSDGLEWDIHELPELLLRYGLTKNVELRLFWPGYVHTKARQEGSSQTWVVDGTWDMAAGVKLEISQPQGWRPRSALLLHETMPTGAAPFSSQQVDSLVSYLYSWELDARLTLGGSSGARWTKFDGDSYTLAHQSIVLGYGLTERWGTFVEWFGLFVSGAEVNRPENYLDGGFTCLVTEDFQLDWRAGFGLDEVATDFFTGVGFAYRR